MENLPIEVLRNCTVDVINKYPELNSSRNESDIWLYNQTEVVDVINEIYTEYMKLHVDIKLQQDFRWVSSVFQVSREISLSHCPFFTWSEIKMIKFSDSWFLRETWKLNWKFDDLCQYCMKSTEISRVKIWTSTGSSVKNYSFFVTHEFSIFFQNI